MGYFATIKPDVETHLLMKNYVPSGLTSKKGDYKLISMLYPFHHAMQC